MTIIWMPRHPTEYPSQISKNRKLGLFRCYFSFILDQFHGFLVSTALDYLGYTSDPHYLLQKDWPCIGVPTALQSDAGCDQNTPQAQTSIKKILVETERCPRLLSSNFGVHFVMHDVCPMTSIVDSTRAQKATRFWLFRKSSDWKRVRHSTGKSWPSSKSFA
jgi:hypothetical protein